MTQIKTARFVVPLIVLGKFKVFARLQMHPKKILRPTNKTHQAREEDAQDTYGAKARKTQRREGT